MLNIILFIFKIFIFDLWEGIWKCSTITLSRNLKNTVKNSLQEYYHKIFFFGHVVYTCITWSWISWLHNKTSPKTKKSYGITSTITSLVSFCDKVPWGYIEKLDLICYCSTKFVIRIILTFNNLSRRKNIKSSTIGYRHSLNLSSKKG